MPSPKSGTAGALVKPTAPEATKDADNSVGGNPQDVSNSGSKPSGSGSSTKVGTKGSGAGGGAGAGGDAPPEHKPGENTDKKSWIELQLVYESNGLPVAGMAYEVTLPDGKTVAGGSTDDQGTARVECIDPGSCQISFPSLDKEAWEDA